MLVLTRTEGEEIVINGKIVVTVVGVRPNQIRLGIEAPKDVPIRRSELKVSEADCQHRWQRPQYSKRGLTTRAATLCSSESVH